MSKTKSPGKSKRRVMSRLLARFRNAARPAGVRRRKPKAAVSRRPRRRYQPTQRRDRRFRR